MGLAEEIARVRQKARGSEINARHRRAQERARVMTAALKEPTPIDGVNPVFAGKLAEAREKARKAALALESAPKAPVDRIEQLVREGKLPPRPGDLGVGYEPTPEEVLGELAEASPPDGTEDLPDAASVLAGDAPEASERWGEAPGAPAAHPGASGGPGLARAAPVVQSKRKRGK